MRRSSSSPSPPPIPHACSPFNATADGLAHFLAVVCKPGIQHWCRGIPRIHLEASSLQLCVIQSEPIGEIIRPSTDSGRRLTMADQLLPSSPPRKSAALSASLLSSPPRAPSSRGKERRNPSITPRKFQRFFTPRSRVSSQPSAVRKALCDLTAPALNRCQTPSSPLKPISEELNLPHFQDAHRGKRRKFHHHPKPENQPSHLPSPLNSSPLLPTATLTPSLRSPIQSLKSQQALPEDVYRDDDVSEDSEQEEPAAVAPAHRRVLPLHRRGLGAQLVQRMTGAMPHASDRALECPVAGRRSAETRLVGCPF